MEPTRAALRQRLEEVNKELWLILSMCLIAALLDFVVTSQRMALVFYTLPTIASAYLYGRRHATLTAFASVLIVVLLKYIHPELLERASAVPAALAPWLDLALWAGVLMLTGYLVGTLYEHKNRQITELRNTYYGVLEILRHFVAKDQYTENHSYRVSVYATRIASVMDLNTEIIEDVRAAALLHDIGKLEISRDLLYKAARLTKAEFASMRCHADRGYNILEPVGGSLRRVLPIVLAHHERFDGSGYHEMAGTDVPLPARIIAVADVYDSLTSDRPYRKAMSPFEAKTSITSAAGTDFDPAVVDAFQRAFQLGVLELPQVVV
jgi:putative nucleotidyltransferase with HDIG domain